MEFLKRTIRFVRSVCEGMLYLFIDLNRPPRKNLEEESAPVRDRNRKLFECPGCQDIPLGPVFTCSSGHIVCELCKDELSSCPICDGNYDGHARNYIVEKLVETTEFPCRFYEEGCKTIMTVTQLANHQVGCYYRYFRCGIVGKKCDGNWLGSVNSMYAHLVMVHDMLYIFKNKKASFQVKACPHTNKFVDFASTTVLLKVLQGKNYVIRANINEERNVVFVCITGLYRDDSTGNTEDSIYRRTTASIRLLERDKLASNQKGDTKSDFVWIGPVNTVDDEMDEILEEGRGLSIPLGEILHGDSVTDEECTLTLDLQIDIYPSKYSKSEETWKEPVKGATSDGGWNYFSSFFPALLKLLSKSGWIVVAPSFTLLIIFVFTFLV